MKLIIIGGILLSTQSFAETFENIGRFVSMRAALGNYTLIKANTASRRVCPRDVQVRLNESASMLHMGAVESLKLLNSTSTIRNQKGCTKTEISAYNDTFGWAEVRGTVICKDRVAQRWYSKIAFDYDFQTVRVLVKNDKRTDLSCTWEKAD